MKKRIVIVIGIIMYFCVGTVFAADATVVSVKGTAAYNLSGKWLPMEAGMKIKEGAKISTGVKSVVVLRLANSTVTVKPLSMMKIYQDKLVNNTSDTKIAVRRGGVSAEVNRMQEVKTVFKVATPVATSSVRGTVQNITVGYNTTVFTTPSGATEVRNRVGQVRVLSGDLRFEESKNGTGSVVRNREFKNNVADSNITPEERLALEHNGEDSPDGLGGALDMGNALFLKSGGGLNLQLSWP